MMQAEIEPAETSRVCPASRDLMAGRNNGEFHAKNE